MFSLATAATKVPVLKKCGEAIGAMLAGQPRANVEKTESEAYKLRVEGAANALKAQAEAEALIIKERSEAMVRLINAGFDPERAAVLVGWEPAATPSAVTERLSAPAPLPVPRVVQALPPEHRPPVLPPPDRHSGTRNDLSQ